MSATHRHPAAIEASLLLPMAEQENTMNVNPRVGTQLYALAPDHVAAILDHLRYRSFGPGSHLVEVAAIGTTCRCCVARHKDHALILLSVVELRGP